MKCLQTVARKRRSFPSPLQRLQRPRKLMSNLSILQAQCSNWQRTGSQTHWQHIRGVQGWQNDNSIATPRCAVLWYHHYLQHPGHTQLEEKMKATMYWKGMRTSIRSLTKSCRACQVNKKWKLKYGHLPPKTVVTVPWRGLCVDLIGPYTLNRNTTMGTYMRHLFCQAL